MCGFTRSDPIDITVQAFLQDNEVVPLSMTHQSLYVNVETQVAIAGVILAGVYVLIIFEVHGITVLLLPGKYLLIRELSHSCTSANKVKRDEGADNRINVHQARRAGATLAVSLSHRRVYAGLTSTCE